MKTYELPLTRDYVRNWTIPDAIREIIQNALDFCHGTLHANIVDDDDTGLQSIHIHSPGASLEPRTLLLGCTTKADDPHSIGSFGEGYKIALLVLARECIDVRIFHSGLVWTPSFTRSELFGEDVLTITEEKYDEWRPTSVTFEVRGLSDEVIEKVIDNTLQLQNHIGKFHRVDQGDILLDRPGKLYVNGLFVSNTDLKFGYNVKPEYLTLERDRQTVSSFDLQFLTKDMWFNTGLATTIAELIEDEVKDLEYGHYGCPELVKEACYKAFTERHPGAVAAKSQHELEALVKSGMTNVVYIGSTYGGIVQSHRSYQSGTVKHATVTPHLRLRQFFTRSSRRYTTTRNCRFQEAHQRIRKLEVVIVGFTDQLYIIRARYNIASTANLEVLVAELYRLSFSNGKDYIGMTSGKAKRRFIGHRSSANKMSHYPVAKAWRKHGEPKLEVLCVGSNEYVAEMEQKAILLFKSVVPNGYNVALGGNGVMIGRRHTEASKLAMSIGHAGKVLTDEHRMRIGIAATGKVMTDEQRSKSRAARIGSRNTDEQKRHKRAIVDGVTYWSIRVAFQTLGLPMQSYPTFRKKLVANGMTGQFLFNGRTYQFKLEIK
jgi:hypothetical protein